MSPSEINGSRQSIHLSLPAFLFHVSLYPEAHPPVVYRNILSSFSKLRVLLCVPVPGLIKLALYRQTFDLFPVECRQPLNQRPSKVVWKTSYVSCWRLQMISYNFPITLQIFRGRKRKEVTPDIKRQLRDKKNKLEDRARLRKAQSLVSLLEHSPHHWWKLPWSLILFVKLNLFAKSQSSSGCLNPGLWG